MEHEATDLATDRDPHDPTRGPLRLAEVSDTTVALRRRVPGRSAWSVDEIRTPQRRAVRRTTRGSSIVAKPSGGDREQGLHAALDVLVHMAVEEPVPTVSAIISATIVGGG
jgi:hypothetical protein